MKQFDLCYENWPRYKLAHLHILSVPPVQRVSDIH